MIAYFCNDPVPKEILHGGHLRFFSLAQQVKGRIYSARTRYPIFNSDLLRLPALVWRALFPGTKQILFSYPNFPFFPGEIGLRSGISNLYLLLFKWLKAARKLKIVVDADDLPGLEVTVYDRPERRGKINKEHALFFERTLFELADVIWVVSERERDWIADFYKIDKKKFIIAPNGNLRQSLPAKELPKDKIKFVYAGSLFRDLKEINLLLKIMAELAPRGIELYIMGYGGDWIKAAHPAANIHLLGSLTHAEAEQYVKGCDVGLLLYPSEEKLFDIAFPVKMSLYITSGKPIVSLDSPTMKEFIEKNAVGLVTPLAGLKGTIITIAADHDLRNRLAANCAKIKESLYWDAIFKKAFEASFT